MKISSKDSLFQTSIQSVSQVLGNITLFVPTYIHKQFNILHLNMQNGTKTIVVHLFHVIKCLFSSKLFLTSYVKKTNHRPKLKYPEAGAQNKILVAVRFSKCLPIILLQIPAVNRYLKCVQNLPTSA
jgi:hypothetical protein